MLTVSERNDFRFCIKRKVIQVKCEIKEKIWEQQYSNYEYL